MTKFIDVSNNDTKESKKETVFTHRVNVYKGWEITNFLPKEFETIKYLGKCDFDGDMFSAKSSTGVIEIFKGTKGDEFN